MHELHAGHGTTHKQTGATSRDRQLQRCRPFRGSSRRPRNMPDRVRAIPRDTYLAFSALAFECCQVSGHG